MPPSASSKVAADPIEDEWLFPQFQKLPFEVRRMIWLEALPDMLRPRIVDVEEYKLRDLSEADRQLLRVQLPETRKTRDDPEEKEAQGLDGNSYGTALKSFSRHPDAFLVCPELFHIARGNYDDPFYCRPRAAFTFFNYALDTLYLRVDQFQWNTRGVSAVEHLLLSVALSVGDVLNLDKIKRLAIMVHQEGDMIPPVHFPMAMFITSIMRVFLAVQHLTFVISHQGKYHDHSQLAFIEPCLVDWTLQDYRRYRPNFRDPDIPEPPESAAKDWGRWNDGQWYHTPCLRELEYYRELDDWDLGWSIPAIEIKIAVPQDVKEELEFLKLRCQTRYREARRKAREWREAKAPRSKQRRKQNRGRK